MSAFHLAVMIQPDIFGGFIKKCSNIDNGGSFLQLSRGNVNDFICQPLAINDSRALQIKEGRQFVPLDLQKMRRIFRLGSESREQKIVSGESLLAHGCGCFSAVVLSPYTPKDAQ